MVKIILVESLSRLYILNLISVLQSRIG